MSLHLHPYLMLAPPLTVATLSPPTLGLGMVLVQLSGVSLFQAV